MDHRELMHFLETNLGRQLQWIGAADSKVAFGFTLATVMLGLLAAVSPKEYGALGSGFGYLDYLGLPGLKRIRPTRGHNIQHRIGVIHKKVG